MRQNPMLKCTQASAAPGKVTGEANSIIEQCSKLMKETFWPVSNYPLVTLLFLNSGV